ncbi:MAG: DUF3198 domain-containing protein [Methanomassiliicoccales archaeon]|nr:DUF3198 domain-containing protein [Methanomassiliicoccales archaeon]TFG56235.1 MAG: DUF3198 domain-containing protein [Methanomassiliicoccus sp.]
MSKPITVERGLELSIITMLVGDILFVAGLSDALHWVMSLGGWGFWAGGLGILMSLVGTVWLIFILLRIKKFKLLMTEKSKAVFVRALDDLEYTAWQLPSKYAQLVDEKKSQMGVK